MRSRSFALWTCRSPPSPSRRGRSRRACSSSFRPSPSRRSRSPSRTRRGRPSTSRRGSRRSSPPSWRRRSGRRSPSSRRSPPRSMRFSAGRSRSLSLAGASSEPAPRAVSNTAPAMECFHIEVTLFMSGSPCLVCTGRAQPVHNSATQSRATGPVTRSSLMPTRLDRRLGLESSRNSCSTLRPRPLRKPPPPTPSQAAARGCTSRLPNSTSEAASNCGPRASIRHASSAAVSHETCSRRRAHHAAGCHHSAAVTRSAISRHAGSCQARCASSWPRIAFCWPVEKSLVNPRGRPIVGRTMPNAIGAVRRADATTRTRRRIPRRRASARTRPTRSPSPIARCRSRKTTRNTRATTARPSTATAPMSQITPGHQPTLGDSLPSLAAVSAADSAAAADPFSAAPDTQNASDARTGSTCDRTGRAS